MFHILGPGCCFTETIKCNWSIIVNVISSTWAFPAMTSQDVCCEKGLLLLHIFTEHSSINDSDHECCYVLCCMCLCTWSLLYQLNQLQPVAIISLKKAASQPPHSPSVCRPCRSRVSSQYFVCLLWINSINLCKVYKSLYGECASQQLPIWSPPNRQENIFPFTTKGSTMFSS